jgi:glycosyltransferase involved in cell wall biosynthesis
LKVLYAAFRHDPLDPDVSSGTDHDCYDALRNKGFDVQVVGPFKSPPTLLERAIARLYTGVTQKRFIKYHWSLCWQAASTIKRIVKQWNPDVLFTLYPANIIFLRVACPIVLRTDTTFLGQQEQWPIYGPLGLRISVLQERMAYKRCERIIVLSDWAAETLRVLYGVDRRKVQVTPAPSSIPQHLIPARIEPCVSKLLTKPIRLLFVGRDATRKNLANALEVPRLLTDMGIPAVVTVCGLTGSNTETASFVGTFSKQVEADMQKYADLYQAAHLLIHPAVFEAAGIVPSEAAAFGTPTITNDTGGLATTVKDGVSGFVLPKGSSAQAYAKCIAALVSEPQRYYQLCHTARERYDAELNWEVSGQRMAEIVARVAEQREQFDQPERYSERLGWRSIELCSGRANRIPKPLRPKMVVLYVALKHDPRDPDAASGTDFNFHEALVREGFDVRVVGPFQQPPHIFERGLRRLHGLFSKHKFLKFQFSRCWRASRAADALVRELRPDVVFTIFPAALCFMRTTVPLVLRLDTTFLGQQDFHPIYGNCTLRLSVWQERRAFGKCTRIITPSEWSRQVLEHRYAVASSKITVIPSRSALPFRIIPPSIEVQTEKVLRHPIRLLFVGRDAERKGLPVALEIVTELNALGVPVHLTVCGLVGTTTDKIRYVGTLRKGISTQLDAYASLYREAHLLVHPALFEAAGIVPSEAAAFATPTITNDTGGLSTTVKDGVSGFVLPRGSSAQAYAKCIAGLVNEPERYYRLCQTTRERYEAELNWEVAGRRVAAVLREAVEEFKRN